MVSIGLLLSSSLVVRTSFCSSSDYRTTTISTPDCIPFVLAIRKSTALSSVCTQDFKPVCSALGDKSMQSTVYARSPWDCRMVSRDSVRLRNALGRRFLDKAVKTVSAQCITALSRSVNVTVNKTPLQGSLFITLDSLMYWSVLRRLSLVCLNEVDQSGE